MPKMKTHSGAKKRFKITGSGKVMHRKAGKMHLNEHKSSTRTRRLEGDAVMVKGDAAKAKKLLADLSVAGTPVKIYYDAGFGPGAGIAEIVQFNLTEAGLKPTAVPLQSPEFLDKLRNGGLDGLFVTGHGFGQMSPATLVKGAFPFNADKNASSFDNAEYKDLANQMWTTVDEADAKAVNKKMNDFLLDQQFVSDLVNSAHTYTTSSHLQGLGWTMLDYINLDAAYLG